MHCPESWSCHVGVWHTSVCMTWATQVKPQHCNAHNCIKKQKWVQNIRRDVAEKFQFELVPSLSDLTHPIHHGNQCEIGDIHGNTYHAEICQNKDQVISE